MRYTALIIIAIFTLGGAATHTLAMPKLYSYLLAPINNYCINPTYLKHSFENAKSIFIARVNEIKEEEIILEINKTWKGNPNKKLIISKEDICLHQGYEVGKSYIIYADHSHNPDEPNKHVISMFSRIRPMTQGQIEIQYLDALSKNQDTKHIDTSLINILKNNNKKISLRIEAAELLDEKLIWNDISIPKEDATKALMEALKSDNPKLKVTIMHGSEFQNSKNAYDNLIQLLENDNQHVVNTAAMYLPEMAYNKSDILKSKAFESLFSAMERTKLKNWENTELYEASLLTIGEAIAKLAGILKEKRNKEKVANILHNSIKEVNDPFNKSLLITYISWMKRHATKALDDIKSYVINYEDCRIITASIEAVGRIDPDGFPEFIKQTAIPAMKKQYKNCNYRFFDTIEDLGSAAKDIKPFLSEEYKTMEDGYFKNKLKTILDALE